SAGATNATEIANGWYYVDLSTADIDTLGDLVVRGTADDCDPAQRLFVVVKATNRGMTAIPDATPGTASGLALVSDLPDEPPTAEEVAEAVAEAVLATPENPLATDASGRVAVATNHDKTDYALSSAGVQAIWDALTSALTTAGSIGKFIFDRIDVVLSTRLAASGYTAPPTAAAIRTEIDNNSSQLRSEE